MKKAVALTALCALFSFSAMAADLTGYIIDQSCAAQPEMRGNVECAKSCIEGGSPAVLVTDDGKIYQIPNQGAVVPLAGEKVRISGELNGDKITVREVWHASTRFPAKNSQTH